MNLKRVRSLVISALPLSLSLSAACYAPTDPGHEIAAPGEESIGVAAQALVTTHQIAGGRAASLAVRSDATVWTSGNNPGDGTTLTRSTPVQVRGLSSILAVAAGIGAGDADDALALKSDGTIWGWGSNEAGQLGDGTTTSSTTPVKVFLSGNGTSYTMVAAGPTSYSLAVSSEGTVLAWGSNLWGQLGDDSGADQHTPVKVSGLVRSYPTAVVAGPSHGMALMPDGTVSNWGFNGNGELGLGSVGGNYTTPVQVVGLSDVTAIAAGAGFALALKSDGTVVAWGNNPRGNLGIGSVGGQYPTPVQVSGLSGITAIAAGREHFALALKSDGTVFAWGNNASGQLGDGTTTDRDAPVPVSGLAGVTAIAAGRYHALAQLADGTVRTWGKNSFGQLGDGTTTQRVTPVVSTFAGGVDCANCASFPMPNRANLPHPASYTINTGYVFDEVTGLEWEQSPQGCDNDCSQADAAAYCAGLSLGGHDDWRLPSRLELVSIVADTEHFPAIDPTAFPGTSNGYYWASTPVAGFPNNAFSVGGAEGDTAYRTTTVSVDNVRCVRDTAVALSSQYVIQAGGTATGTVLDTATGLTWQQASSSQTFTKSAAASYCTSNAAGLPGTGWRLPSMKELQTILDDSRVNPAIDPDVFPSTSFDNGYWTSTPVAWQSGYSWDVLFNIGQSNHDPNSATHYVRCVH